MNCKHVQELLPLYVARDLEETRAQMVAAHVQSCKECACAADEYRETRQLLQKFAPPPFGEEVYAGIRQHVWREIGRDATAPGVSRLLESLFRPRLRWAVATALLLAVCASAFYFIASRRNDWRDGQQVANTGGKGARPTSINVSKSPTPPSIVKNKGTIQGLAGNTRQRARPTRDRDRTRPGTVNSTDPQSMSAQTFPDGRSEPDAPSALDSGTSEKTLRVEMQTRDPNIRIIWFTPQTTKQDSPGKFSKGT